MDQAEVMSPDAAVGETINSLLFRTRTSNRALAAALGVTGATVGRKLRGEIGWSLQDLFDVATFFGIDVGDLLPRRLVLGGYEPRPAWQTQPRPVPLAPPTGLEPVTL